MRIFGKRKFALVSLAAVAVAFAAQWIDSRPPQARIVIQVTGEDGKPLAGAAVTVHYPPSPGSEWRAVLTDQAGRAESRGNVGARQSTDTAIGSLSFKVSKDGYYPSAGRYYFRGGVIGIWPFKRARPWGGRLPVVLKRKGEPVSMLAANFDQLDLSPVIGLAEGLGYDLLHNDWVAPHGVGLRSDMRIAHTGLDGGKARIVLSFPGALDGILPHGSLEPDARRDLTTPAEFQSDRPMPRYAPREGYLRRISIELGGDAPIPDRRQHYFLRIRAMGDCDSKPIGGHYGMILTPIRAYAGDTPRLSFHYFLNQQSGDPNIEYEGDYQVNFRDYRLYESLRGRISTPALYQWD